MGQKTNPISNRLGIIRGWDSNWYGDYPTRILEDAKIREYLTARLAKASLSKVVIERTLKLITVTIHTARPGIIIGKGGQEVDKLKEELKKVTKKDVQINIFDIEQGRADDNEETIKARFAVYHAQTEPLAEWFEKEGIRHTFTWKGDKELMLSEIFAFLDTL